MDRKLVAEIEAKGWDNVEYIEEEGRYSAEGEHNGTSMELSVWFEGEEITVTSNYYSTPEAEYESIPTVEQGWKDTWEDDSEYGVDPNYNPEDDEIDL
jgi:hypothetical protein